MNFADVDELKRRLRSLKKAESRIRFGAAEPPAGKKLVFDEFFRLKEDGGCAKYPLYALRAMGKEQLKSAIDEYIFYVYYRFYRENGVTQAVLYDPELLRRFGLKPDADENTVKRRFRELAMRWHPDHGGDAEKFMEMMEMYRKLTGE